MYDEVNGSCFEHSGCGSWICTATCRKWGVSKAVVRLTNGVSISVTCASPTTAMGDHCSAEMSHCPLNGTADCLAFNPQSLTHISPIPRFLFVFQTCSRTKKAHCVRLWGKILKMCCKARAAAKQWWKTLGVSLGVGRLDLFALCCHYSALLLASNVCACKGTWTCDIVCDIWCAHGRAKYVMHFTAM